MAAITGLVAFSTTSCRLRSVGSTGGLPNSVMSAPAKKVRPSQISTMAPTAESPMAVSTALATPWRTALERAFTGGELTVMTAMEPSTA